MASITTYPSGEGRNMELLPNTYMVNDNDDICLAVSPHLAGQATDSHSNGASLEMQTRIVCSLVASV